MAKEKVSSTDRLFHSYKPMFYSGTLLTDLETLQFPAQTHKHPSLKNGYGLFPLWILHSHDRRKLLTKSFIKFNLLSFSPPPPTTPSTQKITIMDSLELDYLF